MAKAAPAHKQSKKMAQKKTKKHAKKAAA